jgi:NAD(P)-dependent dehydrogenase (short-subunit alcohol dehydrogenase family)
VTAAPGGAPRGTGLFSLQGKTAVITGAGGGIGQVLAMELAAAGADVGLLEHPGRPEAPELLAAIRGLGRRAEWMHADLAVAEALPAVVDSAWRLLGGFDILVNNAGVSSLGWFRDVTLAEWRATLTVNLEAAFLLSQRTAELMIEDGRAGRIIMISSKNGQVAEQGLVAYNTSKAGLEMLARSLAVEVGAYGITVNSVCPGMIDTPMADDFDLDWPAFRAYYDEHIPLAGGFGSPADVAGAVVFLASDAGRYVTGHSLVVDGGVLAQQVPRAQFMPPMPLRPTAGGGTDLPHAAGQPRQPDS